MDHEREEHIWRCTCADSFHTISVAWYPEDSWDTETCFFDMASARDTRLWSRLKAAWRVLTGGEYVVTSVSLTLRQVAELRDALDARLAVVAKP